MKKVKFFLELCLILYTSVQFVKLVYFYTNNQLSK